MYNIIEENLKLASCSINDLTLEQASSFLSQWEDGATLGSLTLFINHETGYLVLNKDHANYEINLKFAKEYLSASDEQIKKYRDKLGDRLSETVEVIDSFRGYKQMQDDLEVIEHQNLVVFGDHITKNVLLSLEKKQIPTCFLMSQAYSYGVINGKRMERAKRKAVRNERNHRNGTDFA